MDPERPLKTEQELRDYSVQRAMSPLQMWSQLLGPQSGPRRSSSPATRGLASPPNTELAKLTLLLKGQFFVVDYSVA